MADQLPRNPSRSEEEYLPLTHKWYFTKEEIENCSPSRKDGITLEQESYLRKLYCSFIQELGVELKVPQVTIATAIILSHRFYMRQSHAKSHWQTIAAVSMFLACKAEETPRLLSDFVIVSYKHMYKWDPSAPQRIKERDVYNQQKELLLLGERLLLATVAFDFNIEQPYKPLVGALKKLQIPHKELVKVAWNFVNDMLRTTLCLQYKPAYIAAGSVSLAAKFLKVKLPRLNGNPWWLLFDVSPRRLEEVIQQMFTLLGQNQKQTEPSPYTGRTMTESKSESARTLAHSAESCISSLNVTAQNSTNSILMDDERRARFSVPECTHENSANYDHGGINEAERFQPSDHGSTNRIVKDGDGDPTVEERDLNPSCKMASKKIDVNRIREMIKRRKTSEFEKKQAEGKKDKIDSESLIERELENGKECDLNPSCEIVSKKIDVDRIKEMIKRRKTGGLGRKRVEGTEDEINSEIWIERELENGIRPIVPSPKKQRIV